MYSPKISEALVRQLYHLKQIEKRPMTRLANEAIEVYLKHKRQHKTNEESNDTKIASTIESQ